MNIIITGSLAYDRIMDFPGRFREHILPDKIHILNVSFVLEKLSEQFGGTAGNIAYNLKLLDLEPVIAAAAGGDFNRYAEHLEKLGISAEHIQIFSETRTAVAHMITDLDDNQISAFYPGALARGAEVALPDKFANKDNFLVIAPSSKEEMDKHCLQARQSGLPYLFDPGQQITALAPEELAYGAEGARVSIFNDYEWQMFQKKTNLEIGDLTEREGVVIITQGRDGSRVYAREQSYQIGIAEPDEVQDPTGAGDAYRAGIAAGIVHGWDWQTAGQVAATVASFAVEEYGTQEHTPSREQISERYQQNFGDVFPR